MLDSDIVLSKEYIIKVQSRTEKLIYGYDILTEKFCSVKVNEVQAVSKPILELLNNSSAQYLLLKAHLLTDEKIAEFLKVNIRTVQRLKNNNHK